MKNISLALNVVLIIAIIPLYVMIFSGNKTETDQALQADNSASPVIGSGSKIAFVNMDSLQKNYAFFQDITNTLTKRRSTSEAEFASKYSSFETKALDLQDKYSKGLLTSRQAEAKQSELLKEEEELKELQQQLSAKLVEDEFAFNKDLIDSIQSFLKDYQADLQYHVVLGKAAGSAILFSDNANDITDVVIKGLNARYLGEKKK